MNTRVCVCLWYRDGGYGSVRVRDLLGNGLGGNRSGSLEQGSVLGRRQFQNALHLEGTGIVGRKVAVRAYKALIMHVAALGRDSALRKVLRPYGSVAQARNRKLAGLGTDGGGNDSACGHLEGLAWQLLVYL